MPPGERSSDTTFASQHLSCRFDSREAIHSLNSINSKEIGYTIIIIFIAG